MTLKVEENFCGKTGRVRVKVCLVDSLFEGIRGDPRGCTIDSRPTRTDDVSGDPEEGGHVVRDEVRDKIRVTGGCVLKDSAEEGSERHVPSCGCLPILPSDRPDLPRPAVFPVGQ